ncbi:MAG: CaiB/BaiF CoA-transferase family protein [Actinomycetota bacterium]|nr:CaiB/BaiF CoA-transferase family protein [Actinomycetota bacterium]
MGALDGVRVIELAGIGPGPFCGMMLADMGADVIRVDRATAVVDSDPEQPPRDVMARGRRSVGVDIKNPEGREAVLRLVESADMCFEGFRPGVAERLGVGPEDCLARNPALVYGRMTGWGQEGPYSSAAGHDINYIALAGALAHIGRADTGPVPPLNLVGDFGGGGMYLAFGMVCALVESRASGRGQVVDAAMVDGVASLMSAFFGMMSSGFHTPERGVNLLDTGAHFYDVYQCADGEWISLGAIEPQFYKELLERLELDPEEFSPQHDRAQWPELKARVAEVVATRTRDGWDTVLAGTDVCYAPVLSVTEAVEHPHNIARGTFVDIAGVVQPGPAPRLSRTPGEVRRPPAHPGQHTEEILGEAGFDSETILALRNSGAVA